MIVHYGFKDGSGDWYLVLDTDRCDGCGKCVGICPSKILEVGTDELDPFREELVAFVKQKERNKIRYYCALCKPMYGAEPPPCVSVCKTEAISHSEGWKRSYKR